MGFKFQKFFLILVFLIGVLSFSGITSAAAINDTLHLNIQTTFSNGSIQAGTFSFGFNITESSSPSCLGPVVYNHSTTSVTDSRGIVSIYLPTTGSDGGTLTSLDFDTQYNLCYYRNGTLESVSQISRVPYAFRATQVNLSEIRVDSNLSLGSFNFTSLGNAFIGRTNATSLFVGVANHLESNDLIAAVGDGFPEGRISVLAHHDSANAGPTYSLYRTRGSEASPSATQEGDLIGILFAAGHDGTDYGTAAGSIRFYATENYTSSAQGARISFRTIANGSITLQERLVIENNGFVGIGTASPNETLHVIGKILASGNFKFNDTNQSILIGTLTGNTVNRVTAVGYSSGSSNTGIQSSFLGVISGSSNTANDVTAIGYASGQSNSGSTLTAVGISSGSQNTGFGVVAIGSQAGFQNSGTNSVFIGSSAGLQNLGNSSTAVGVESLRTNTGNQIVALGFQAGNNNTGDNVVAIGYEAGENNVNSNVFILRHSQANSVPLIWGNFTSGNVGIGTTTPARNLHINDTLRIEPRATAPSSAALGDIYVDSTTSELCFYNGTAWTGLVVGGACA